MEKTTQEMSDMCACCPKPGMCCEYVQLPLAEPLPQDVIWWLEFHPGMKYVEKEIAPGITYPFVQIDIACQMLRPDGGCELYDKPERPKMCRDWGRYERPEKFTAPEGCVFVELEVVDHASTDSRPAG